MKLRSQPFPSPRLGTDHRKATRAEMQQLREGRAGTIKDRFPESVRFSWAVRAWVDLDGESEHQVGGKR